MQEARARELCKANGWEMLESYVDVMTGKSTKRPALKRFEADMRAGRFDAVICYKVDRLGRNRRHLPDMLMYIREKGIKLVSMTQQIDMTTSAGRFQLDVLIAAAVFEIENMGERVSDTMLHIAKQGRHTGGRAPYGYRYLKKRIEVDEQGRETTIPGRLEIIPEQAEVVRLAFETYLEKGMNETARVLNAAGYRSAEGKPWTMRKLQQMVLNPIYGGERGVRRRPTMNGKPAKWSTALNEIQDWLIVPSNHEAIVAPEVTARARARYVEHRKLPSRTRTDKRPFTGLMVCGLCGRRLMVHTNGWDERYLCPHRAVKACDLPSVPCEWLYQDIIQAIAVAVDGSTLNQAAAKRKGKVAPIRQEQSMERQVAAKQRELSKLEFKFDNDVIDGETFIRERKRILSEIESIQAGQPRKASPMAPILPASFGETWAILDAPEHSQSRRNLIHMLVRQIVCDQEKAVVHFHTFASVEGLPESIEVARWGERRPVYLRRQWSRNAEACVSCGGTELPVFAKDKCVRCYNRDYYRSKLSVEARKGSQDS